MTHVMRPSLASSRYLRLALPFFLSLVVLLNACKKQDAGMNENASISSAKAARNISSDVVTKWYDLQTRIMLNANPNPSPAVTGRIFAYEGLALYEAVRHGIPNSVPLNKVLYQMPEMPAPENKGYSWPVAANAAMAFMTRNMFAGLTAANHAWIDSLESAQINELTPNETSEVSMRSSEFGKKIASAIFEWSKSDGISRNSEPYTPPVFPGAWTPTPPAYAAAALPYMGSYRPMLEMHLTGVIAPFPHTYSETPGSDFYNEVNFTYQTSKNATPEQKTIARFWADVGVGTGYSTPGHHFRILTSVLRKEGSDLGTAAIAYAKAGIATRDAFVMIWRSKYTYNMIRPVSYIRKVVDPAWLPYITTPNHPEYPAAHATLSSAVMETLAGMFGENYSFSDNTYEFLGIAPRHYNSFEDAATEAGWSRVYGGIHYRVSVENGLAFGKMIGKHVNDLKLQY